VAGNAGITSPRRTDWNDLIDFAEPHSAEFDRPYVTKLFEYARQSAGRLSTAQRPALSALMPPSRAMAYISRSVSFCY
jgi:hypothetical protein